MHLIAFYPKLENTLQRAALCFKNKNPTFFSYQEATALLSVPLGLLHDFAVV